MDTLTVLPTEQILAKANQACDRIAPLWPLKSFVAVNPYYGLSKQSFEQVHHTLKRILGTGLTMPANYYLEARSQGRITPTDLTLTLQELNLSVEPSSLESLLLQSTESLPTISLITDLYSVLDQQDFSRFVLEQISQFCAAYFDEGQAYWTLPWRDQSLYRAWVKYTSVDQSGFVMGLRSMKNALKSLPTSPQDTIVWATQELGLSAASLDTYFHALLLSIGGWAAWTRYLRWQSELKGETNDAILELLAIRLAWDVLIYQQATQPTLKQQWLQAIAMMELNPSPPPIDADILWQRALEINYQRHLVHTLSTKTPSSEPTQRADLQAVFCIDVRSEVYRRSLETLSPNIQTIGFAGFFGMFIEYERFGAHHAEGHVPILFKPTYRITEQPAHLDAETIQKLKLQRHVRMRRFNAWKTFKTSAASCFTFVEAAGILSAPKLISDSMGWSRPVPHPHQKGLKQKLHQRLSPGLGKPHFADASNMPNVTGIPEAERPAVAEFTLRNMGLSENFARIVLFVGHGSTTVNNPQATALDCGACAGQSGEASARIAASLLNDPSTRQGLLEKGIVIPADTYFMAALHDTITDEVHLFNTDEVPASHSKDLLQLEQWFAMAGKITRVERATLLGTDHLPVIDIEHDMHMRARDWAQVRPEWGLAGNAAFIAAPRSRTANRHLAGRAFLHEYDFHKDQQFSTLKLIMTAPMIVANWINLQYYGSMVDNDHFGSGNKVLHNVVGGSIGVFEGNGGDLRIGLAIQSLHDGKKWIHEPLRLNVFIEAPKSAIDNVMNNHELVLDLVSHGWIHLFQIEEDGTIYRWTPQVKWHPFEIHL